MPRSILVLRLSALVVGTAYAAYAGVDPSDAFVAIAAFVAGVSIPAPRSGN